MGGETDHFEELLHVCLLTVQHLAHVIARCAGATELSVGAVNQTCQLGLEVH